MGLREKNKIRTKKKILDVSTKLFHKKGYELVGIREIADKSGISVGTYYNYFSTKEDIIFAMIDGIIPTLFKDWENRNSKKNKKDPTNLLIDVFKFHFSAFAERIFIVKEFFNIITNPRFGAERGKRGEKIAEYKTIFWDFIVGCLESCNVSPNPDEYNELRSFFWSIYVTSVYHWIQDESEKKTKTHKYLQVSLKTFIYGLESSK